MDKIDYKIEYLDLIYELTTISEQIIFNKTDDSIINSRHDEGKTIAYHIEVPNTYFNIDKTIGIYDYKEFYRFIKTLDSPDIIQNDNNLTLVKDKSKLVYTLSDTESLKPDTKKISWIEEYDCSFDLSKETLNELIKINNNMKSTITSITCSNDEINLKFMSKKGEDFNNSFDKKISLNGEIETNFDFIISSDIFEKIPKRDYVVNIKNPGHIKITLKDEFIKLNIFISRLID